MTVFIAIFPEGLQGWQDSTTVRTILCNNVAAVRERLPAPGAIIQPSGRPISTSIGTTTPVGDESAYPRHRLQEGHLLLSSAEHQEAALRSFPLDQHIFVTILSRAFVREPLAS